MGRNKKGKELRCFFCKQKIVLPKADELLRCNENGGTCQGTVYAITKIHPSAYTEEQRVLQALYEKATGTKWDPQDWEAAEIQLARKGFLVDGLMVKHLDDVPEGVDLKSVLYVRKI